MNQTKGKTTVEERGDRELFVSRVFDATPEQVFHAFTDAEALKKWWGPRSYPTVYCTVDLRPGGAWHYCLQNIEDAEQKSWGHAIYGEISRPDKLTFEDAFSDKDANRFPPISKNTYRFIADGGRTRMEATSVYESAAERQKVLEMGVVEGLTDTLDRLDEYFASGKQ